VGERFLLTIHKGPIDFLERVRRDYHDDFVRFAQSPSFLVYEIWDHLTEHYVAVQKDFEDRVELLQRDLIRNIDDALFARVSQVGAHLLYFRKILLPARAVLAELSTRKTVFVSEATQPFLSNMIGTIDRVLGDALVDRDILTQSLNLHMSLVSHQTNRLMNKLTVVSVIFLPLSFLAGVYGMNFEVLPELKWAHGYALFWAVVVTLVLGLVVLLRRLKLL
jgi:magnesium transporter